MSSRGKRQGNHRTGSASEVPESPGFPGTSLLPNRHLDRSQGATCPCLHVEITQRCSVLFPPCPRVETVQRRSVLSPPCPRVGTGQRRSVLSPLGGLRSRDPPALTFCDSKS